MFKYLLDEIKKDLKNFGEVLFCIAVVVVIFGAIGAVAYSICLLILGMWMVIQILGE